MTGLLALITRNMVELVRELIPRQLMMIGRRRAVKDADTANLDETWGLEYLKAAEPAENWKVGAKIKRVFKKTRADPAAVYRALANIVKTHSNFPTTRQVGKDDKDEFAKFTRNP